MKGDQREKRLIRGGGEGEMLQGRLRRLGE